VNEVILTETTLVDNIWHVNSHFYFCN